MKITPIPKHCRNDGDVVIVFNNDITKAIKLWKVRLNNYKGGRILRDRSEHPAPRERKKWKRVRAEKNRKRGQRRAMV